MGRCCPGVALGLLALAFVANNPRAEFATITNTVYDCQYDLTEEQCADCFGTELISDDGFTFLDDVYAPKDASCINSAEGCCKTEDGYEYFLMSSLANYGVGKPTQFFYPGASEDKILYLSGNDGKGRCEVESDSSLMVARCKILPMPPPSPPTPPSAPTSPSSPPSPPPSPPPPGDPPPPPPPVQPPNSPPTCDSRRWSGDAYIDSYMDIEDEYGVPTGVFGWVRRKTHVHFNNCCELAETIVGEGGVVQALGEHWCVLLMAQDEYGNMASDYW